MVISADSQEADGASEEPSTDLNRPYPATAKMFDFLFRNEFTPCDAQRLRRIEQKLDLILKHLQVEFVEPGPGEGLLEPVRALADGGNKIAAIKKHRELTGDGLVEAKRAVEAYMSRKA